MIISNIYTRLYLLCLLYFVTPFVVYYIKYKFQFSTLITYLIACTLCFLTTLAIVFVFEQYLISVFLDFFNMSKEDWDNFEFGNHYNKSPEENPTILINLYKFIKIMFFISEIVCSLIYVATCFFISEFIEKQIQERYGYKDDFQCDDEN